jgi:cardiolipin synthase
MNIDHASWLAAIAVVVHWTAVLGFSARVIMRRRPVGVLLAWIALILSVPVLGILLYLFVGENRISRAYLRRGQALQMQYQQWKKSLCRPDSIDWDRLATQVIPLQHQAESLVGFPVMAGNSLVLLNHYEQIFQALIEDINRSQNSCHLEFYICHQGGLVDELVESLLAAGGRGVACRLLLDAVGSKTFLRSRQCKRMQKAGIEVVAALPTGLFNALYSRADLRNHRKIAVIDGVVAYTGSQNLVDPRYFKQDEGVGQWVDAMLRIEGPVVEAVAGIFIQDWEVVTGVGIEHFRGSSLKRVSSCGNAVVQLAPSGPQPRPMAILQLVLSTIYAARRELIITTPYFVPDESVLTALKSVAHSGVDVTLIVPEKNDSRLVDYASRAVFEDLLSAGIRIAAFRDGLLHTKSISVDGEFCIFGSVNLDMRSLWLNFELSLFIYDAARTAQIRDLQLDYLSRSADVSIEQVREVSLPVRFLQNAAHLLAPLL